MKLAVLLPAERLVDGATALARAFGVTERFIAVTLIAVGTSLPELATTVVASLRGERDIAVANAIGSNIFNILLILGLPAVIHPIAAGPNLVRFDLPAVAAAGALLVPIFVTDCRVSRLEGWGMIALYGAYIAMLATGSLGG
ncbi:MAG: hypothetical protein KC466_12490 [Myxococcales bacterium]|nr:hypothetical protein [Myxococcales bacterium]